MSNKLTIKTSNNDKDPVVDDAHHIRETVFVAEQGVPLELEYDGSDEGATHYVGYLDDQPVVTARVTLTPEGAHIQRVATIKEARHHGYAQQLLTTLLTQVVDQLPADVDQQAYLGAQLTAVPFYERLGFEADGPVFLDAGIQHREMKKQI